ncbi:CDP-glycerol glycerophosphotransferase [Oceanobacillus limi]|uniref:CDP-glycerol glycerophosphotransferase n=1 Tax=Oceanobacillus limi TaxID=930131 RepID=A0A1I0A1J9_9BACI|nr:CDP-glycerol glycerophosphotransferase [Oceanobacillus limi]
MNKKKMKKKLKRFVKRTYKRAFRIISKLPRKKGLVVFESFHGKQFSDNPRAIFEYMKENHPEYKLYWSVDRRFTNLFDESGVMYVKRWSIKWLFVMGRANYWVMNSRLPLWIPKPEGTIYLQTWHGTPLKKLGVDIEDVKMPGTNTEKYKRNFLRASQKWDYLVSPNEYASEIFKRAFGFENTVLETGYPRNDFLINENKEETRSSIKEALGIPTEKKVILYAPTWRDNQFYGKGRYRFNLQLDLQKMQESFGDDYVIVLRLHYLVAENLDIREFEGFVYDCSKYRDIRDLYLISDLLITDYSSVFFDFAILKRPIIFYVYDIEDYRDNIRGFYYNFEEEAPGPLVKSTDEIIEVIHHTEKENYELPEALEQFHQRFCYLEDGNASERVVEHVFN